MKKVVITVAKTPKGYSSSIKLPVLLIVYPDRPTSL